MLIEDLEPDLDEQRDAARFISESADRVHEVIEALLDHGQLGQSRDAIDVDLEWLVVHVLDAMKAEHGVDPEIIVAPLPHVRGFSAELRLLFEHLIDNALTYRRKDRRCAIHIDVVEIEDGWQFSVRDNGIGIPPERHDEVFNLLSSTSKEKSGLGLAHCRKIVELHHGRIFIDETPGGGTTVTFILRDL